MIWGNEGGRIGLRLVLNWVPEGVVVALLWRVSVKSRHEEGRESLITALAHKMMKESGSGGAGADCRGSDGDGRTRGSHARHGG